MATKETALMDKPFIIWALRRTGGTTFAALLAKASSHPSVPHEPFNPDRVYGWVSKEWNRDFDVERMRTSISEILQKKSAIKHCYEVTPHPLNILLLLESARQGYHQIFLRRRAEVDRMFSLKIAELTGAWGAEKAESIFEEIKSGKRERPEISLPTSITHMSDCKLRSTWLEHSMQSLKINYSEVYFEDLYEDLEAGTGCINKVLSQLGHSGERIAELKPQVELALSASGQGTRQIDQFVKNSADWRRRMQLAWDMLRSVDTAGPGLREPLNE
ncbi:MAG: hypothetical protein ACOH2H_20555 [Cypionkella sp.]